MKIFSLAIIINVKVYILSGKKRKIQGEKSPYSFVYLHTNSMSKFHNYALFTDTKKKKKKKKKKKIF